MRPRLIFVNRYFFPDHSATSQLLTDLTRALEGDGHEVIVVTSRQLYDQANARLDARCTDLGVRIERTWSTAFGRSRLVGRALDYTSFLLSAGLWLLLRARPRDTLVLMTDPPMLGLVGTLATTGRGVRRINWLQDLFPETAEALGIGRGLPLIAALYWLRDRCLRAADCNVCIGERMQAALAARIGDTRSLIVHNWAPGDCVQPLARANNTLRRDWQLGDRFVVGYSGNMGRAHEFETILGAAGQLRAHGHIHFLFIGGGAQHAELRREAQRRDLDNLSFQPYQPLTRLAESLSAADVHLVSLNPLLEGCIVPSKFYGIAAAGRPALFIGAADGEIARLLGRHACGAAFAAGDVAGLARAILDWSTDPQAVARMSTNARRAYSEHYSLARALGQWRGLLGAPAN